MDMIALEFEQEYGYDMMLAEPELREWYIKKWMDKNFYDQSQAPGEKRVAAQEGGRIGYAGGADYYTNLYSKYAQEMIQAGKTPMSIEDFVAIIKEQEGRAQGGRVGYQFGIGPVGGIQGISPMRPQLPMNPQAASMNVPPPREGGLGRLPIEADMRYTGGFMPYGEEEKADDVPARLSKNEFVFTADAVRAAGGGSVNQGAKKLYDTMKQLEAQA